MITKGLCVSEQVTSWDAIIVNFNSSVFLDPCLRALASMRRPPARMIVVDNNSTDDSLVELAGWPSAEIIESKTNLGYAGGANLGIQSSSAPIAVVLNPDVELDIEYGDNVLQVFTTNPEIGVAGAKLLFPDRRVIQHAGARVNWPLLSTEHYGQGEPDEGQCDEPREVSYVTGAAIAFRREAFDEVGGFDESFYPAYWEDVDICWQLRAANWQVRYEPALTGVHFERAGQEPDDQLHERIMLNRLRMAVKYMSHEHWWRDFVPAEMARLRGELSAVESMSWPTRSGAKSVETLARAEELTSKPFASEIHGEHLLESISAIRGLHAYADPRPAPLGPGDGVGRRIKRALSRISGRFYAEELYWHQRQFNESVVRAFEAQDRLNRELVSQLLMSLLLIGQRSLPRNDARDH